MFKLIKMCVITILISFYSTIVLSSEKTDCSKIKLDTGAGWLKKTLCKKGSDKIDTDGNFKKGTFNLLKKLKTINVNIK